MVGSVDTSEFLVALAASIGFLAALGSQGIDWAVVGVLLAGGVVAAPIAAWLVQKVTARLLGASVGGLIVITNVRTFFDYGEVPSSTRWPVYMALLGLWAGAIAWVVRAHRRETFRSSTAARSGLQLPRATQNGAGFRNPGDVSDVLVTGGTKQRRRNIWQRSSSVSRPDRPTRVPLRGRLRRITDRGWMAGPRR